MSLLSSAVGGVRNDFFFLVIGTFWPLFLDRYSLHFLFVLRYDAMYIIMLVDVIDVPLMSFSYICHVMLMVPRCDLPLYE